LDLTSFDFGRQLKQGNDKNLLHHPTLIFDALALGWVVRLSPQAAIFRLTFSEFAGFSAGCGVPGYARLGEGHG